jgi:anthranilate phosphoribosyltransferase
MTASKSQIQTVLANSGFAIHTIDPSKSIEDCIAQARESLESGKAFNTLRKFVEINQ